MEKHSITVSRKAECLEPLIHFEHLFVTTSTVVIPMMGKITNCDAIFSLFEVTHMEIADDFKGKRQNKKKFNIPFCPVPGSILSIRFRGLTRGIITSESTKQFRNSITIDISTSVKNVNIKLSATNIHICGAKNKAIATEAAEYIVKYSNDIQDNLDHMRVNPELVDKAIAWMENNTVGDEYTRHDTGKQDHSIVLHKFEMEENQKKIVEFFYSLATDFIYHSDMMDAIKYHYTKIDSVCEPSRNNNLLAIDHANIRTEMSNYNFDIGFSIDRWKLYTAINDLHDKGIIPFIAQYFNCLHSYCSIYYPYEENISRPRGKKRKITFMVYSSGRVTMSCRNAVMGEPGYNKFNAVLMFLEFYVRKNVKREYVFIK
uniref:Transcription factor TFIID n=1 Tax=Pithovirus LCPAC404 TaxID=2506597 RepID=A0A481ZDM2_9VIRU|nr:MAG: transcription factor TFIID [Pithovirus LCPAC404]